MLLGEAGFGREALAVELAAGLVCRTLPLSACSCPSCQRVRHGNHPDVEVVDLLPVKPDKSGVDVARELIERLPRRPYEGTRRVVILASAQTPPMSSDAAAAVLKAFEEPPAHLHFLLLASNPARVLPTIVSRSVQLRVAPPEPAELQATLAAALDVRADRVDAILASCHGDAGLALETGDADLATTASVLRELTAAALSGDSLALLRIAAAIKGRDGAASLAIAALLDQAARSSDGGAELPLDAAAAIMGAVRRHEALNVDLEGAVLGALVPFSRR
jgi:hypothetical protein